jgi:hypothetical protein
MKYLRQLCVTAALVLMFASSSFAGVLLGDYLPPPPPPPSSEAGFTETVVNLLAGLLF